jgi:hypothetical protein
MENNFRKQKYDNFLEKIIKKIEMESVKKDLKKMQDIDLNHYSKIITIESIKEYIEYFKNKEIETVEVKNVLILTFGNPEIVFKSCIEAVRKNVNMEIVIQDFCLAQNTLIIEMINKVIKNNNLKIKLELKNLISDKQIIELSKNIDKVICIGDSNLYNRLEDKVKNIELNSFGIFEIYSDSEEYEELEKTFFDYCYQNEFEAEDYSDLEFEDALRIINKNGYKFASVLFSKDKEKQEKFKTIDSKYIVINKNPFKEIDFKLKF